MESTNNITDNAPNASGFDMIDYETVKAYMAENYTDSKSGWKCKENCKEKDGRSLTIYQRKVEGSKNDLSRYDVRYKGHTLEQFKNVSA